MINILQYYGVQSSLIQNGTRYYHGELDLSKDNNVITFFEQKMLDKWFQWVTKIILNGVYFLLFLDEKDGAL